MSQTAVSSASPDAVQTRIARWLAMLADVTAAGAEPVSAERIATMAGLLGKDMPEIPVQAYTSDSLHHVAGLHRFFPAYAEVRAGLSGWWQTNRPRPAAAMTLPGLDIPEDMDAADRGWVHYWHKRRGEIWAKDSTQAETEQALARLASLVRENSPKAWAVIRGPEPAIVQKTEAIIADVAAALEEHRAELHSRRLAPEDQGGSVKLPDVAVRGEHLAAMRARRGVAPAGR